MPWQKPKADHPWRKSYKSTLKEATDEEKKEKVIKPVKIFLTEIVKSWNKVEVITTIYGKEDRYKLSELPQRKIAAWLAGLLRRQYD